MFSLSIHNNASIFYIKISDFNKQKLLTFSEIPSFPKQQKWCGCHGHSVTSYRLSYNSNTIYLIYA